MERFHKTIRGEFLAGRTFASQGGVQGIIPVDVMVPGCPPPPLAILHGLLVAVQRKPPAALTSPPPQRARGGP